MEGPGGGGEGGGDGFVWRVRVRAARLQTGLSAGSDVRDNGRGRRTGARRERGLLCPAVEPPPRGHQYALRLAGAGELAPQPVAVTAIVVLSVINYLGVKPGSRVLNVFVVLKVAALAALILFAWFQPSMPGWLSTPRVDDTPSGAFAFGAALIPILFAYGGWQVSTYVAEEMRDPVRHLPRALQLKRRAPVMNDGGVRRAGEPAENRVGLVTGAADRVVTVPRRAQLVRRQIEVPRAQHRFEQLPQGLGGTRKIPGSLERGRGNVGSKTGHDLVEAIEGHG